MKPFKKLSIKRKINYLFVLFFVMLMLCVIVVIRLIYSKNTRELVLQSRMYEDNLIARQAQMISDNVNSCANSVIVNINNAFFGKIQIGTYPDIYNSNVKRRMFNILENSALTFLEVSQLTVLFNNGDMYRKGLYGRYEQSVDNTSLLEVISTMSIDTKGQWYYDIALPTTKTTKSSGIYYVKTLRDIQRNVTVGYVLLEVDENTLYMLYKNDDRLGTVSFYIAENGGVIVSSDNRDVVDDVKHAGSYLQKVEVSNKALEWVDKKRDDKNYVVSDITFGKSFTLISVLDIKSALSVGNDITIYVIFVAVVILIIFYTLFQFIVSKITGNITKLANHMKQFKATLPQTIPSPEEQDEIGVLMHSYNQMVTMNKELFVTIDNEKRIKRHMELALLQSQIKPHFLYNTLDIIFCLNAMGRQEQASQVTKLLAGYYRLVLNKGEELIPLEQEIEAVRKYLDIQAVRYSDNVSYTIDVPEGLYDFCIPKITIQPLIENAIYHGIKPKGSKGNIAIKARDMGSRVLITITDDGVGMTSDVFNACISGRRKATDSDGFGIKNVNDRIKLFYGKDSGITLEEGVVSTGTALVLCLYNKD